MDIFRWWRELRDPSKKCERRGHRIRTYFQKVYRRPEYYSQGVMSLVTETQQRCVRCGFGATEFEEKRRKTFTSVSWPADMWDTFDEKGEIVESRGWM